MAVIKRPINGTGDVLRIGGTFTAAFSLVMGLLVLFVIPSMCSFLVGLELIVLGFLFIMGVAALLVGLVLHLKR